LKKAITLIAALVAVLAVTSGAFAAKQYMITSSKQIKHGAISLSDLSRHARKRLHGVQGAAGPTGPEGPRGDQGLQGPKGNQGQQGPKGGQGPSGVNSPLVFGPYQVATTDSGFCGTDWATDTYNVTFVVAPQADGSFVVSELMKGGFKTLAGASPNATDCNTGAQINAGITGSLYGDFVVPVAPGADFNPTATLENSTPCGGICTSDKFFSAFFGKPSGYTNSTAYAWQFHYTTPGDVHGHWADTDHSVPGDLANGDIHN
jgi:hypothetical protein